MEADRTTKSIGEWGAYALIATYALASRALGFFQPYHQDENTWVLASDPAYGFIEKIPHPFLAQAVYQHVGGIIGYGNLRLIPIVLSLATLALLIFVVRRYHGRVAALIASALYVLVPYSLIGSLQIDIDGAFLPFFALLSYCFYRLAREEGSSRRLWLLCLGLALSLGFASKLSFVLVPVALIADYVLFNTSLRTRLFQPKVIAAVGAVAVLGIAALMVLSTSVPFLSYVTNFLALSGRDYFQVLFQSVKAVFFLSPLVVFGIALGIRHSKALSFWFLYLALGVVFYLVLFDFSHRTLDRYLLIFVLPGVIIAGVALARLMEPLLQEVKGRFLGLFAGCLVLLAGATHLIFSLPHTVIPLIPKTAFIDAVAHGQFSILIPMTGGSGPLGFYMPLDGLVALWTLALASALLLLFLRTRLALAVFLASGLVYMGVMTLEFIGGTYYGSGPRVLAGLVEAIDASGSTETIITYNNIGAFELRERGLYAGRFYPHDAFVPANSQKLARHTGRYLVVGIPALNPESVYGRYFAECTELATARSGVVIGTYYTCDSAARNILTQ